MFLACMCIHAQPDGDMGGPAPHQPLLCCIQQEEDQREFNISTEI